MSRKITIIVIIIVAILSIIGLIGQITNALDNSSRLDEAATKATQLQSENRRLKETLSQAQKPEKIEEISRNELNMAQSNETIVIIPQELLEKTLNEQNSTMSKEPKIANWQGWLRLFLH